MMKKKTNFDLYLEEQLKDPGFAQKFIKAGEAWDVAIQLVSLRKKAGLSQKELAKRVGTSQQQISRLESPSYEGHSLSMLRRVAEVLGGTVRVEIQQKKHQRLSLPMVAEPKSNYKVKKTNSFKRSRKLFR
jgi:transcriptional regulator with XRE-family HTH domain